MRAPHPAAAWLLLLALVALPACSKILPYGPPEGQGDGRARDLRRVADGAGEVGVDDAAPSTDGAMKWPDGASDAPETPTPCAIKTWCAVAATAIGETLNDVWGTGPDRVWAVGNGGTLLGCDSTLTCSEKWSPRSFAPATAGDLLGVIAFADLPAKQERVIIVGRAAISGGTLIYLLNDKFSLQASGTSVGLPEVRGVWGTTWNNLALATIGSVSGTIWYFDGGYVNPGPTPGQPPLNGISGNGTDVYVVDSQAQLNRYDGFAFEQHTCAPGLAMPSSLLGIWAQGQVYAVGVEAGLPLALHLDPLTGTVCTKLGPAQLGLAAGDKGTLHDVWVEPSGDVYVVGKIGGGANDKPVILRRDVKTGTWTSEKLPKVAPGQKALRGVWGSGGTIYAVGDGGLILRRAP